MVLWDTVSHDRREWYLLLAQWEWGAVSGTGVGMSTDEVLVCSMVWCSPRWEVVMVLEMV